MTIALQDLAWHRSVAQLIEALVEGDLGGRFTRRFGPEGMAVGIRFPLHGA